MIVKVQRQSFEYWVFKAVDYPIRYAHIVAIFREYVKTLKRKKTADTHDSEYEKALPEYTSRMKLTMSEVIRDFVRRLDIYF